MGNYLKLINTERPITLWVLPFPRQGSIACIKVHAGSTPAIVCHGASAVSKKLDQTNKMVNRLIHFVNNKQEI